MSAAERRPEGRRRARQALNREDAPAEAREALRVAGALLARRARSESELRERLTAKGFRQPIIETALGRLRTAGLIDDHSFASDFARSLAVRRGLGPRALREQLLQRGIAPRVADEVLAEYGDAERQRQMARQAAASYLARHSKGASDVRGRRLYTFLWRRGFEDEVVREVLSEVAPEEPTD